MVTALTLDGREKWVSNLGSFKGRHGGGASLVVYNGLVWINNDQDGPSSLIALKVDSGAVSYKIDRLTDKVSYGTPCLCQEAGRPDQLIFASSSHGLTSVNPLNGAINWDCTNLFEARVVSSPIRADGLIICTEWDEFRQLDLEKLHAIMGQPIVLDGRNLYDPQKMAELGFVYKCIGR